LVYDGICNLCIGAVRFLKAIDHEHVIEYAPYQKLSPGIKKTYGLGVPELQGRMHLIRLDGSLLRGSVAIAAACKLLSPFTFLCDLFNTKPAQRLYDFVARRRYKLFGCRDTCYVVGVGSGPTIRRP
jgi:predicted DCC family thiol-disulfide oxidoreductase YuxK